MATRQELLTFIKSHPDCNTKAIAEHFGFNINSAATRTKQLFDGGHVTRKQVGINTYGKPLYIYNAPSEVEGKTKKERLAIAQPSHVPTTDKPIVSLSMDDLVSGFVSNFAQSLVGAIITQLKPRLEEELRKALPAALPKPTVLAPSEPVHIPADKPRLPRVGILGVQPPKRCAIDTEFGELFDLTYWCSDDGDNRLKPMAHSCETIFVMDYVSHKHTQLLQARGANLRRVNGDIRALTDLLTGYFLEQAA